eukprot:4065033-Alexandrium_andersonii.AAC.1
MCIRDSCKLKFPISPQRVAKWAPKASADERLQLADWACTVTGALNDMPSAMDQYFVNTFSKQMVASH